MPNNECTICDEPINADNPASELDATICAECDDESAEITRYELSRAGIEIDDDTDPLSIELAITFMTLDDE